MMEEDIGVRLYCYAYSTELIPTKLTAINPMLAVAAGPITRALKRFYESGYFIGRILGEQNATVAQQAFVLGNHCIDLPLLCSYKDEEFKIEQSATSVIRLLKPSNVRELFKLDCEQTNTPWAAIEGSVATIVDRLYHDSLVVVGADAHNQEVLKEVFEDQENIDLKVRLSVPQT